MCVHLFIFYVSFNFWAISLNLLHITPKFGSSLTSKSTLKTRTYSLSSIYEGDTYGLVDFKTSLNFTS